MRLRNVSGSKEAIESSPFVCASPERNHGKWGEFFGNENPLHIEIGMGMGRFIREKARLFPEVNFIGIERYSGVLARALRRFPDTEERPANLALIWLDANKLEFVFREGEVTRIYLNFSDPWPKKRHAHRRLTSRGFLVVYQKILADGGAIELKTDNRGLFDFTLAEGEACGLVMEEVSYDWHNDPLVARGNVMTEYEEKFSLKGEAIYRCVMVSEKS